MRFTKKKEVSVALKCQDCGNITDYPIKVFPRKEYLKRNRIMQACDCDGAGGYDSDMWRNSPHKIVGVFVEQQIPIKHKEAIDLLGDLAT